jgi:transcriptional regulator with XRE-family HTH domain
MDGRQRAARAVAARRGELRWTQHELGAAAGVDVKTIGNLEKRGVWPIARTRAQIEEALGWPPGELERIAAREGEPELVIPPGLLALIPDLLTLIRRRFPPDRQQEAVDALGDILMPPTGPGEGRLSRRAS